MVKNIAPEMEQLSPIAKSLVRRNDCASFLIPVCDEAEEQITFLMGDGGISHLIKVYGLSTLPLIQAAYAGTTCGVNP